MNHYVDTHAHIFSEQYADDFDEMLKRCEEAGVDQIMIITLSHEETVQAVEFAKKDPVRFQVAAGIFPEDVRELTDEMWEEFRETVKDPMISCVGEIGLDYYWEKDPDVRALQREVFIRQIELAKEIGKPILVHSRDAMQDTYDILKAHHTRGLLHCFSGTKEMAVKFTKLGYYIALGGAVTFKNARHSVEVCEAIDESYLVSETDCPYMAPTPYRGKRNEPSYIPLIVKKMAEVRGVSEEHMAAVIKDNWTRFLNGEQA